MAIRKAINIGSSVGVTLPKRFLQSLRISAGDQLEVKESGASILIRPVAQKPSNERVTELALNFVNRYREDLEALADE